MEIDLNHIFSPKKKPGGLEAMNSLIFSTEYFITTLYKCSVNTVYDRQSEILLISSERERLFFVATHSCVRCAVVN